MTDANEALRRIQQIADSYVTEGEIPVMVVIQTICRQALQTDPGYVRVPDGVAPHCDYGYITPAKGNSWFAYDPEGDSMLFFETEEEARAVAQKSVSLSLDEFWSEDVDRICYGRVTHAATQVNRSDRPESLDEEGYDEDGEYWPADCEFKCNYELLPIAATKETSHD